MRYRYGIVVLLIAAVLSLTLASCASPAKKNVLEGYEHISLEPETEEEIIQEEEVQSEPIEDESNWLSALGDIKGLDIKSYQLRGEGPDGASFDWIEVTTTKVALSDVRRGQWTLYARAIGENGEILATGQLETFLSDSSPMGAVYLDSEAGQGNARCAFVWNTFQVLFPTIEIYVKKGSGEYIPRDSSEISIGNGVAVWNGHDLGAGSYVVRAILKDEGEIVAGVAAAMRILDGKLSVGDVRFIVGKLSTIYGISLNNSPVATIRGDLDLDEETGIVKYTSDSENLRHDWFLNGDYMVDSNGSSVDIAAMGLEKGFYRIDCIVQDANETSINSDSILVYADGAKVKVVTEDEADGAKGDVPTGYNEIVTNSESLADPDSFMKHNADQKELDVIEIEIHDANLEDLPTEILEEIEEIEEIVEEEKVPSDEYLVIETDDDDDVIYFIYES